MEAAVIILSPVFSADLFPSIVSVEVPALSPEALLVVSVIVPAVFPIDPFVAVSEILGAVIPTDVLSLTVVPVLAETLTLFLEATLMVAFVTSMEELLSPDLTATPSLPVPLSVTFGDFRVAPPVSISNSDPASVLAVIPFVEVIPVALLLMLTAVALTPSFVPAILVRPLPSFTISELLVREMPSLFRTILLLSLVL